MANSRTGLQSVRAWGLCVMLASVFAFSSPVFSQSRQEWRDSLETLNRQIRLEPANIGLRLLKAEANINMEQWDYALAEYGKILHQDEHNLAAFYFRAYVHTKQQHYDLARVDYETFLSMEPHHFEARLGLAHTLMKMGRRRETTDELNRLVEMFPDSADAYAARAAYETEMKAYELALYDWDKAIELRPLSVGFTVSKADILITLYRHEEAYQFLQKAVKRGIPRNELKEWMDKCRSRRR